MRFSAIGMLRGLILGASTVALVACGGGGGGGSSGGFPGGPTPTNDYKVTLSASRTAIPLTLELNPCVNPPSLAWAGAATVYVNAKRDRTGDPIPGGDDVFGCNVLSGLESGALYYFRGNEDDQVTILCGPDDEREIEGAFRNIVLGSNAGGNSFHVLSGDKTGTVVVRCTATDPLSGEQASKDISIAVGPVASGLPSQVVLNEAAPNFLFVQGATNGPTQLVVQVEVLDEAGQRVPNPSAGSANLMASIVTGTPQCTAGSSANLRSGGATGKSVTAATINGQAQFSVVSGTQRGTICVEFYADRSDNNVTNGIANLVYNGVGVPVDFAFATSALAVTTEPELPDGFFGTPYAQFLAATGGVPPYTWALGTGSTLPSALTLSTDGVISGTPTQVGDSFGFVAQVTDAVGAVASRAFQISIKDAAGFLLRVATTTLPEGTVGVPYAGVVTAVNGTPPYTWTALPNPVGGITVNANGTLTGTPGFAGTFSSNFTVTDSTGATASKVLEIEVQ